MRFVDGTNHELFCVFDTENHDFLTENHNFLTENHDFLTENHDFIEEARNSRCAFSIENDDSSQLKMTIFR